jgi:hypothetical protein
VNNGGDGDNLAVDAINESVRWDQPLPDVLVTELRNLAAGEREPLKGASVVT